MERKIEECSICGEYAPVGKYGGKSQPICDRCLNRGRQKDMTPIVKEKIPGRNDLCACGSGLKFKKCCL